MNDNFKIVPIEEYHIHEVVEGIKQRKFVTYDYNEALDAFDAGCIVYEVHKTNTQSEWMTVQQTVFYEWHQ
ncbi:MAG: hypothetical protein LBT46_02160 [Planctomycetaceae bacterium]|jgi:hypothetical protein|nr:hypothetical protein [Planctomycetaceae bacterium]